MIVVLIDIEIAVVGVGLVYASLYRTDRKLSSMLVLLMS